MSRRPSLLLCASTTICLVLMAGCTGEETARRKSEPVDTTIPPTVGAGARPPLVLPDLSIAAPSVQEQLRQQFKMLNDAIAYTGGNTAALAPAYGETGVVLMAANYVDVAEAAFINAQTLAPSDLRW